MYIKNNWKHINNHHLIASTSHANPCHPYAVNTNLPFIFTAKPDLSGSHPTTHNQGNLEEKMQELLSLLRNRKENQQNKEEDIDDFPDELQLQEEREHFEPDLHTRHRQKRNALAAMTDPDNDYVFTVAIFVDPTIYD